MQNFIYKFLISTIDFFLGSAGYSLVGLCGNQALRVVKYVIDTPIINRCNKVSSTDFFAPNAARVFLMDNIKPSLVNNILIEFISHLDLSRMTFFPQHSSVNAMR